MTDRVRIAIEDGDPSALRELIAQEPHLAHDPVRFGDNCENSAPPLHLVCDAVFRRLISQEQALALADVLLDADVDLTTTFPKTGDTYLISAASLGAELVGVRLVEKGADVHAQGLFDATALHWSAFLGVPLLTEALVGAGADLELRDSKYQCTPLEWGLYAWNQGTNGLREQVPAACAALLAAGAVLPPDAAEQLTGTDDGPMRAALEIQ